SRHARRPSSRTSDPLTEPGHVPKDRANRFGRLAPGRGAAIGRPSRGWDPSRVEAVRLLSELATVRPRGWRAARAAPEGAPQRRGKRRGPPASSRNEARNAGVPGPTPVGRGSELARRVLVD